MNRIRGPPEGSKTDRKVLLYGRSGSAQRSPICKILSFSGHFRTFLLTNNERSLYIKAMMNETKSDKTMTCEACNVICQRYGKHRNGLRRFRCPQCNRTYTESHERTLGAMYITADKASTRIRLLIEGNSMRVHERITGLDINTLMSLLVRAGERCQSLMDSRMRNLHVKHIQIDEIWTYVAKKNRHVRKGDSPECWRCLGFRRYRRYTKLVPAFHVGKRHREDTRDFLWNLYNRIEGRHADHY